MMFVLYLLGSGLAILGLYALLKVMGRAEPVRFSSPEDVENILNEERIKGKPQEIAISSKGDMALVVLDDGLVLLFRAMGHFWQWRTLESAKGVSRNDNRLTLPATSYTDPAIQFPFREEEDAVKWAKLLTSVSHLESNEGALHA